MRTRLLRLITRSLIRVAAPLMVFGGLLSTTRDALAQSTAPDNCNRPLPNAVTDIPINGVPQKSIASRDGCWLFVFVSRGAALGGNGIDVYRRHGGTLQLTRSVPIDGITGNLIATSDGKMLLTRSPNDAVVLDAERLASGQGDPVLGRIGDHRFGGGGDMAVTADNRYLFVRQMQTAWISIIDLEKARREGFGPDAIVGGIAARGDGGPAITLSPDQRYLYLSNQTADAAAPRACKNFSAPTEQLVQQKNLVAVVDIQKAIASPSEAVIQEAVSGCHAAPFAVSPDGNTVYFILYVDSELLAFDVRPVRAGLSPVLIGRVPTGQAPRDLALVDEGRKIIVANSNLYGPVRQSDLTVIDATRIAQGPDAVLGTIATGMDTRRLSVSADGRTLFVSNLGSSTLQVIDLDRVLRPLSGVK